MAVPFSGGCACGAIRYQCSAEPAFSWNCHCRDCQRASGSAFCPVLYVPRAALTITGQSRYYDVKAALKIARLGDRSGLLNRDLDA
jgi:hypothetical protein